MKVLVAIRGPERESGLLETAAALAGDGEVVLASAIEVTGDATLASAQPEARARRRALDALTGELPGRHLRSLVTVARVAWDAIREACATERPDLLLVGRAPPRWGGPASTHRGGARPCCPRARPDRDGTSSVRRSRRSCASRRAISPS